MIHDAWPGDLVKPTTGLVRLYKYPGPIDEEDGNPVTGIAHSSEVGLILATTDVGGYPEALFLFGDKLGWRDLGSFHWLEGGER